jgi:hypothetical protein
LTYTNCSTNRNNTGEAVETIPVSISNLKKGYFSEIFDSVRYIPLETTDDILIAEITKIHYVDNRFFILDKRAHSVFIFDEQGHCIRKIQSRGQGPKEYNALTGFDIDEANRKIYLFSRLQKILVYDWDAQFIEEYHIGLDGTSVGVMKGLMYLYTYSTPNQINGKTSNSNLLIINKNKIQKALFPFTKQPDELTFFESPNAFYKQDSELRLYMPFSTKIYSIKGEDLYVRYFFDFGEYNLPESFSEDKDVDKIYDTNYAYGLNTYWENNNYCSFSINVNKDSPRILFDKKTKEIKKGFFDDLSYCFPRICEATDNYAIGFRNSEDLFIERKHSNPQKDKSLLMEVVKKITEDSNPVVFIYYFKKH